MTDRASPIAYFAFNRPVHTDRTLTALAANPEARHSDLHAFVDGPRNDAERDLVRQVADIARARRGFASVTVHTADSNQGLYKSITRGVAAVVAQAGRVIVVEDDILVSPSFLAYMNQALDRFRDHPKVGCIHAYSPSLPALPGYFFLPGGDCWGWATWADRWSLLVEDPVLLLEELIARRRHEEFASVYGYQSLRMLAKRALGKNQSWAILWHCSLFLCDRLTLHARPGFAVNIGTDGSGTHSLDSGRYDSATCDQFHGLPVLGVAADPAACRAMSRFLDGTDRGGAWAFLRRLALRAQTATLVSRALR